MVTIIATTHNVPHKIKNTGIHTMASFPANRRVELAQNVLNWKVIWNSLLLQLGILDIAAYPVPKKWKAVADDDDTGLMYIKTKL